MIQIKTIMVCLQYRGIIQYFFNISLPEKNLRAFVMTWFVAVTSIAICILSTPRMHSEGNIGRHMASNIPLEEIPSFENSSVLSM